MVYVVYILAALAAAELIVAAFVGVCALIAGPMVRRRIKDGELPAV